MALFLGLVCGTPAFAQAGDGPSIDGAGRITVFGGYRWIPNWYFEGRAAAVGMPVVVASKGGPQFQVGFGFGATEIIELAIDLFAGVDWFELSGAGRFTVITYGGLIGPRLTRANLGWAGFAPYLGVEAGPTFVLANSSAVSSPERLAIGAAITGGFQWRLQGRWAFTFDVRWLWARGAISGVSGLNGGGVLLSVGVSYLFPKAPQGDLEVPGFGGSPSNL